MSFTPLRRRGDEMGGHPQVSRPEKAHMLDILNSKEPQGIIDALTEGVTSLTPLEMNRVLSECGYEGQRAINERHVEVLADLMRRGRWQAKSQIDFAVLNGRYILVNGYHRAYAQVRSGKTIIWSIMLHPCKTVAELRDLYFAFDTNIRMRSGSDILKAGDFGELHGITGEMAASLYRAVPYIASKFILGPKTRNYLIDRQVDLRLHLASEYAKAASRYAACLDGLHTSRKKKFTSGAMTAVALATLRYQSDAAWQFWYGTAQADGLKRGDPRLALWNDVLAREKKVGGSIATIAPQIIAWNAFFNDRQLRIIKVTEHFVPVIDGTPFDGQPFDAKTG